MIVGYVGEAATNVHGGYNHDRTARYTAQWALGTHLDLRKLLGWDDAEFQLLVTERNGNNLSNDRISDPARPAAQLGAGSVGQGANLAPDPDVVSPEVFRQRPGSQTGPPGCQ